MFVFAFSISRNQLHRGLEQTIYHIAYDCTNCEFSFPEESKHLPTFETVSAPKTRPSVRLKTVVTKHTFNSLQRL